MEFTKNKQPHGNPHIRKERTTSRRDRMKPRSDSTSYEENQIHPIARCNTPKEGGEDILYDEGDDLCLIQLSLIA